MFTFGIDSFVEAKKKIGERVALLSNKSSVNKDYISSFDILYERYNIVSLFAPEHGFYGVNYAGESVQKTFDLKTGIPVYSLYNNGKFSLTEEMLKTFDIMIFDVQDLGLRFYTYISTLKLIIKTLGKFNKKLIILDRPLILGGDTVEGNILDENSSSFVGPANIPIRYALTIGELGILFNEENNYRCTLEVIPMKGWNRKNYFNDLNRAWIKTSPAISSFETALMYAGTCLLEGTNLSEGRGTYSPFEVIGAPFIDENKLSKDINNMNLPGIITTPHLFKPYFNKYNNTVCKGIYLHVLDKKLFKPVSFSLRILNYIRNEYPSFILNYGENSHTNKLLGKNFEFELDSLNINGLLDKYKNDSEIFKIKSHIYHIY